MLSESTFLMPDFENRILGETIRCNGLINAHAQFKADGVYQFSLQEFRDACQALGKNILTDELLAQELAFFDEHAYRLREWFVPGMKVVLSIFPCDDNGLSYTSEDVRDDEYFHILRQPTKSSLWLGYTGLGPSTHGFMLPAEMQGMCSFIVDFKDVYSPTQHDVSTADLNMFKKQFTQAFLALRMLLNLRNSA